MTDMTDKTDVDIADVRKTLENHGQEHLLAFFDGLDAAGRQSLKEQIQAIDFDWLDDCIKRYVLNKAAVTLSDDIKPPEVVPAACGNDDDVCQTRHAEAKKLGEKLLGEGKVAAFTVAGGQGTRLGYEGPKGCFPATPVVNKPLFRLFAEKIRSAAERHRVNIPWYIMTSPANDTATQAHFRQNDFWGFSPKDIIFLRQGTIPAIDFQGKLLMARKGQLALSPDGHGGSLTALRKSGALDDMKLRGIEYISYFQVDNPLVQCIDPTFIGLHAQAGAQMSAKCLPKRDPMEKLGNFCIVDGRVTVIEYSDMPEALAMACNCDGRLKFSAGSIAIHIFSRSFVEQLTDNGQCLLPMHRAEKKVPFIDPATGQLVQPTSPNAVKLEMFVFDALPLAEKTVIFETRRNQEFSPIKNAEGLDSPVSSLRDQVRLWAGWLEYAGITVPLDAEGQVAAAIEISPLYADSAEELAARVDKNITISAGQNFYLGSRGQIGGS